MWSLLEEMINGGVKKTLYLFPRVITMLCFCSWIQLLDSACVPHKGCSTALAYYTLNPGDNLNTLVARFQTTINDVQVYNTISNPGTIPYGTSLLLPFRCECMDDLLGHRYTYTVQLDDTVEKIAILNFEGLSTVDWISRANGMTADTFIYQGNPLQVPVNCSCGNSAVSPNYGLFATYPALSTDNITSLATRFQINEDILQQYNPLTNFSGSLSNGDILFIPVREAMTGLYPPYNSSNDGILKSPSDGTVGSRASSGHEPSTVSDFSVDKSVQFSFEELAAATNNFNVANKIGQGGYGAVYLANLRGQKMAVKRMNLQATREFLAELQVLTHVHHTNLVQLIGYCTVDSLFLIYEFVENGTLDRHLHGVHGLPSLSWPARVQIALDTARGLEYIHEHTQPTYIHRDVKSSNILIDKQLHAKVADFGLTKLTESGIGDFSLTLPTRLVGTFGYMSPEYARFGDVSPKMDVYSFGVVLFEIISAKEAIVRTTSGSSTDQAGPHKEEQIGLVTLFEEVLKLSNGKEELGRLVDPALHCNYPLESAWKMAQLAGACTQESPELRPSMRVAVVALMTLSLTRKDWDTSSFGSDRVTTSLMSGR